MPCVIVYSVVAVVQRLAWSTIVDSKLDSKQGVAILMADMLELSKRLNEALSLNRQNRIMWIR